MRLHDFIVHAHLPAISAGFVPSGEVDLQGWNSTHGLFRRLMTELRPRSIIEVGSWKGASAIHMARIATELGLDFKLLCIDAWLGGDRAYVDHEFLKDTLPVGGVLPMLQTFLRNVHRHGFQDRIFPMPSTSVDAAESLRHMKVRADLIYIDAGHKRREVMDDLCGFWPVLKPGGVLFGDDYIEAHWPGVVEAVRDFAAKRGLPVEDHQGKFVIRKPVPGAAS